MNFTQYLRPDGRKRPVTINRSPDIEAKAAKLVDMGCVFGIEELANGHINMDCVLDDDMISCYVCENGPEVPENVDALVNICYSRLYE